MLLAAYLFKGWLYREAVSYKLVAGRRSYTVTDTLLANAIAARAGNRADIGIIIRQALSLTANTLTYRSENTERP